MGRIQFQFSILFLNVTELLPPYTHTLSASCPQPYSISVDPQWENNRLFNFCLFYLFAQQLTYHEALKSITLVVKFVEAQTKGS